MTVCCENSYLGLVIKNKRNVSASSPEVVVLRIKVCHVLDAAGD